MEELRRLTRELRDAGLTDDQIRAGVLYYTRFCRPLDINFAKCVRMLVRMVRNMREAYEKS